MQCDGYSFQGGKRLKSCDNEINGTPKYYIRLGEKTYHFCSTDCFLGFMKSIGRRERNARKKQRLSSGK